MGQVDNLIYPGIKSSEQAKIMGRKGGLSRSPKKKWAARLRSIKKQGLTDKNYKRLVEWMEEPESSVLDVLIYLESIRAHCKNAREMTHLSKAMIDLMKAHHGDKVKTENVHHVINWGEMFKNATIRPEEDNQTDV